MHVHAYSQNESAAALYPVSMRLPPGVGAIDFYLDLAIDCVNTTSVTMPCFVMTDPPAHDPFVIIKNVSSICASAKVGQYFGFYNHAGELLGHDLRHDCCQVQSLRTLPCACVCHNVHACPATSTCREARFPALQSSTLAELREA